MNIEVSLLFLLWLVYGVGSTALTFVIPGTLYSLAERQGQRGVVIRKSTLEATLKIGIEYPPFTLSDFSLPPELRRSMGDDTVKITWSVKIFSPGK